MLWLLLIPAAPFLVWLWLGVSFTMIDFAVYLMGNWIANRERELFMEQAMEQERGKERARIIRYTHLDEPDMPGLLSFYDKDKNILHIDRELADNLTKPSRERLEMTEHTFTRLARSDETGMPFKPYTIEVKPVPKQVDKFMDYLIHEDKVILERLAR